jgi:hypothetical protein
VISAKISYDQSVDLHRNCVQLSPLDRIELVRLPTGYDRKWLKSSASFCVREQLLHVAENPNDVTLFRWRLLAPEIASPYGINREPFGASIWFSINGDDIYWAVAKPCYA